MAISFIQADYNNPKHASDLLLMLNAYASDPMGGGQALSSYSQQHLIASLKARPFCFSILGYDDERPVAVANCIEGFSTFKCKALVNIHDFAVIPEYRGKGISQGLMQAIESIAKEKDCCKITLEVLQGNKVAQNAYLKAGFTSYELDPEMGAAMFWEKPL